MTTRDIVLVALFTALVVVLGMIPGIPLGVLPVPFVLQNLGLMLAGAILGGWRGALVAATLAVLVAIGLPVLSGGRGGFGVLAGPTGGFILGWIPGTFVTGLVVSRVLGKGGASLGRTLVAVIAGVALGHILVVYAVGIVWLSVVTGTALPAATIGMAPFVPVDLAKAVIAGFITHAVARSYPIARR